MKEINKRIKHCRRLRNLTQTDVAEMLGIKCSTYSQMERKGEVTCERLIKLSEILMIDATFLLYGERNIPVYEEEQKTEPRSEPEPQPLKPEPKWSEYAIPDLNKKERDHIVCLRSIGNKKRNEIMLLALNYLKRTQK